MSSRVERVMRCSGAVAVLVSGLGLAACGDGGGSTTAAAPVSVTNTQQQESITHSDIVLPSSVQVVTAK
jgi:ABC-type glycerol-3-phosphate transport system substrate-binding protein